MCEEIGAAERKRKNRALRQKWFAVILLLLVFAIPIVVIFNSSYASWHFFTKNRIKELEQIFSADFPEGTVFERYKKVYAFQEGEYHTLYITGIDSPEDLCRHCINGKIKSMTDFCTRSADEIPIESWYDGSRKKADLMCSYDTQNSYYTVNAYFFKNENGSYDAKFIK